MGNSFSKRHRAAGHKQTQAVKKKNERTRRERFLSNKMKMNKMMLAAAFAVMAFGAASVSCDMHEAVVENATDAMMNATMNATDAMIATEGEESTDDAGTDGGEASEDDSRRKLLDMHEAMMEEATDAMMNATMNATDAMMNGTMNGTMMNGTEEEHDHD